MRVWVIMALVLLPVVGMATGGNVEASSSSWCARTTGEVKVGLGPVPVPLPILAGLSYVDVPFHSCSGGGYWLDPSSENVQATRICPEGIVRVWAVAGEAGQDYIINWKHSGTDDC